jgi:hypothetical protein
MNDQPAESAIFGPINLQIEEAFVALLSNDPLLVGLEIVAASDREITVPPLHCFVYCDTAVPQTAVGFAYKVNVSIVLVTNIDDHSTALRKEWWGKVLQVISRLDQQFEFGNVRIVGWALLQQGETSDGQQTGDILRFSAGALL